MYTSIEYKQYNGLVSTRRCIIRWAQSKQTGPASFGIVLFLNMASWKRFGGTIFILYKYDYEIKYFSNS